jgi:hypothetical protein
MRGDSAWGWGPRTAATAISLIVSKLGVAGWGGEIWAGGQEKGWRRWKRGKEVHFSSHTDAQ